MNTLRWYIVNGLIGAVILLTGPGSAHEVGPKKPPEARLDPQGDPLPEWAMFRLGTVRYRQTGYVSTMAMTSDGRTLALNNNQGSASLIDAATGKEIRKITGDPGGSSTVAFTPDGKKLVSWGFQGVQIVDVASGASQGRFPFQNRTGQFGPLSLSADGKTLVLGSSNFGQQNQKSHLVAMDLTNGKEVGKFEAVQNFRVQGIISGDGKVAVSWGQSIPRGAGDNQQMQEDSRTLQVWDVATGKELRKLKASGYGIASAALSADGQTLAVSSGSGSTLTLWNTKTGKEIRRWACRRAQQGTLTFSPDGKMLALADSVDGTLQLWDTSTHKRVGLFEGQHCRFCALAFLPKGTIRLCGIEGQAVVVWEVHPDRVLSPMAGHRHQISFLHFSGSGKELLSAGSDGTLHHWDLKTGNELRRHHFVDEDARRYGFPVYQQSGLVFSPDGKYFAGYSQFNNNLRLRELPSGKVICDFEAMNGTAGVVFSPDSQFFAVGGRDRVVRVWNIATGQEVCQVQGQGGQGENLKLAFSPDGKTLAMRSHGFFPGRQVAELLAVDVASGKVFWKEETQNFQNTPLAFTSDGKYLLVVDPSKVSLRNPVDGKEVRHFQINEPNINGLALSPDNRLLALSRFSIQFRANVQESSSGITVLELASGQVRCRFNGHQGMIPCLAFSNDGKTLASGGADTTVMLWNVRGGRQEQRSQAWTPKEIQEIWEHLSDSNGDKVHLAIDKMLTSPSEAIALLEKNLTIPKPVTIDPKQIQQWIVDLGSDRFAVRESATKKLQQAGRLAAAALTEARKGNPPLEVIRRLDHLLSKLQAVTPSAKDMRRLRAVEVLEMLATAKACELLQQQARGIPGDPVTEDALSALKRLPRKGNTVE
ncbi:MAG TPA: hypothetical protein VKE98_10810 [Gemmataceae bacterium]|nr:hypothetical protein [Gemmataceae bacterium]